MSFAMMNDSPHEECGIIGIFAPNEDVSRMAFFGLFALQHRGQEAAGIAVSDGATVRLHKEVGLVAQVFNPQNLAPLRGHFAIGHTRYSTTGSSSARNAQPFLIETRHGPLALAHNGNLINAASLRQELLDHGGGLYSSSDTEVMTMMLAGAEGKNWNERLKNSMTRWTGAYSLVILTRDGVLAVRDPWGFRPLSVGLLPSGGWAAASESGALRTLGCEAIREVQPGEIVTLSNSALSVQQALPRLRSWLAVSLSKFIFPVQTAFGTGRVFTMSGRNWAGSWPRKIPSTRMLSFRCPIFPSRRPLDIPPAQAFHTTMGLSRTVILGAPLSNPPTRCENKVWR